MTFDSNIIQILEQAESASALQNAGRLKELCVELSAATGDNSRILPYSKKFNGILAYLELRHEEAIGFLTSAYNDFKSLTLELEVGRVAGVLGNVNTLLGNLDVSMEWYNCAVQAFTNLNDETGIARITGNIGTLYRHKGDFTVALQYFEKALLLHQQAGDSRNEATVIGNIGNVYVHLADYPRALEYYLRALHIHDEIGDVQGIARVTGNIGIVYCNTAEYSVALEWLNKALELRNNLNQTSTLGSVHGNMANVYAHLKKFDQSMVHVDRAIELAVSAGDNKILLGATVSKFSLYIKMGQYGKARELSSGLLERIEAAGNSPLRLEFLNNLATLLFYEGNLEQAAKIAKACNAEAKAVGKTSEALEAHMVLYHVAKARKEFEDALYHFECASVLDQEILGMDKQRRVMMLETEQRLSEERKQAERDRLIAQERENLLHSILPKSIAERLLGGEKMIADTYDEVSVIFLDMVNFTSLASHIPPAHLIYLLDAVFAAADKVMLKHGLTKIKTIGDAYLAVAGIPDEMTDNVGVAAMAAVDLMDSMDSLVLTMPPEIADTTWTKDEIKIQVRIGLHIGPVVAGVIGHSRTAYDIWGDAVNTAARMEQNSEPGRIHVSSDFYQALSNSPLARSFNCTPRAEVVVKGKGILTTYWLQAAR